MEHRCKCARSRAVNTETVNMRVDVMDFFLRDEST